MSDTVIKVENLSKQYRLGSIGTGTLSHDLNRWWHMVRGKEDPYAKVGDTNDRTSIGGSEYVWALKDINFEIKQGEILGIIGKNGAGKSTLLKILSKVTGPTTGKIQMKGRVASLLEVGTGFHPELTGRENIYLNGAVLGMTKAEVKSKLEEIVYFAGVAKYIDTPVKRYSSGMMVRLGFAVAAHLEPEILIVDEVLAVGDAEFQKKAIGKMQDISNDGGRTVLFVSHNMGSISKLCNKSILLSDGRIHSIGETNQIIETYLTINDNSNSTLFKNYFKPGNNIVVTDVEINNFRSGKIIITENNITLQIKIWFHSLSEKIRGLSLTAGLYDYEENYLGIFSLGHVDSEKYTYNIESSSSYLLISTLVLPKLHSGTYKLFLTLAKPGIVSYATSESFKIEVSYSSTESGIVFKQKTNGYFLIDGNLQINKHEKEENN